jgi:hypothetical protein
VRYNSHVRSTREHDCVQLSVLVRPRTFSKTKDKAQLPMVFSYHVSYYFCHIYLFI